MITVYRDILIASSELPLRGDDNPTHSALLSSGWSYSRKTGKYALYPTSSLAYWLRSGSTPGWINAVDQDLAAVIQRHIDERTESSWRSKSLLTAAAEEIQ